MQRIVAVSVSLGMLHQPVRCPRMFGAAELGRHAVVEQPLCSNYPPQYTFFLSARALTCVVTCCALCCAVLYCPCCAVLGRCLGDSRAFTSGFCNATTDSRGGLNCIVCTRLVLRAVSSLFWSLFTLRDYCICACP